YASIGSCPLLPFRTSNPSYSSSSSASLPSSTEWSYSFTCKESSTSDTLCCKGAINSPVSSITATSSPSSFENKSANLSALAIPIITKIAIPVVIRKDFAFNLDIYVWPSTVQNLFIGFPHFLYENIIERRFFNFKFTYENLSIL